MSKDLRVSFARAKTGAHSAMSIWVNGALAGQIVVRQGSEETVLGAIESALKTMPGVPCTTQD